MSSLSDSPTSVLHTVCLPCFPTCTHPLLSDAAWDEMFEAFIVFAKTYGFSVDRHERPMLFKDRRTKAVWRTWKAQWTTLRLEKLNEQKPAT